MSREEVGGAAQSGKCGPASESGEVLEIGIASHAGFFGDVTGETGAEIAGAGGDENGIEIRRASFGLVQGGGEGLGGNRRGVLLECLVERTGVPGEEFWWIG